MRAWQSLDPMRNSSAQPSCSADLATQIPVVLLLLDHGNVMPWFTPALRSIMSPVLFGYNGESVLDLFLGLLAARVPSLLPRNSNDIFLRLYDRRHPCPLCTLHIVSRACRKCRE